MGVLQESRGKRPFKLWDGRRSVRKGLVVGSLEELVQRGRDKLGVSVGEPVRLVLESDGTQVEDAEYFRTLPANTILLLLRPGERWLPAGVDVIRAGRYSPPTASPSTQSLTWSSFSSNLRYPQDRMRDDSRAGAAR